MSGPYVYTPHTGPYTYAPHLGPHVHYHNSPYHSPFYNQQNSPFIPPASHLNGSPYGSPYSSPYGRVGSLPPSPNFTNSPLPSPNAIPFPSSPHESPFVPPPWLTSDRERRGSWNGAAPPQNSSPWLNPPQRQRTRSDVGYNNPFQPPANPNTFWYNASPFGPYTQLPTVPTQYFLNPLLDPENRQSDLIFDISHPQFLPLRRVGNNQTVAMPKEVLDQTATHPPIYRMHIITNMPNWPVDMSYNPTAGQSPFPRPITVGDVLSAIYNAMQMRISQADWESMDKSGQDKVGRAWTKRCRAIQARGFWTGNNPEGVKKVDFLLGRILFKGLERVPGHGPETTKLVVTKH